MSGSIFNTALIDVARFANKQAFVDPATAGGGAGMPPGGAPPMDPAAMGGAPPMDPAAMGGAPPMDPAAMGGAPAPDIGAMIQQAVQTALQQQGGGASAGAGAGAAPKMKIDINIEIMQIKKILAKIVDALGIGVPAQDLAIDQNDVAQMAQQNSGGGGGSGGSSPIGPIGPIQGAPPPGGKQAGWDDGAPYPDSGIGRVRDKAAALAHVLRRR